MEVVTERLLLRRFRPEDVEPLAAILLQPEVLAWLGPPGVDRDDVARAIERYDGHWKEHGYGRVAVVERATGNLVGRTGVMSQHAWTATACRDEIGWAIDPDRWGDGLATEAAAAALRDVFERVGLEQVVSFALPANAGSLRVMAKLGFAPGGTAEWEGTPHLWCSISPGELARAVSVRDA